LSQVYLDQSAITDQLVEEIIAPSQMLVQQGFASVFKSPKAKKVDVPLSANATCPLLLLWEKLIPWMPRVLGNARDNSGNIIPCT
jgi:hypothetical protein